MNKKNLWSFITIVLFISFLLFSGHTFFKAKITDIRYVEIAGVKLKVDLALTPPEQEQGLSGRTELKENEGMLFVFGHPDKYLFWMKDMNFPIDMVWIGENLRVVYIKKNALPASYPQSYGPGVSDKDALYVLEVVAGFSDKNNLKEGDRVQFIYR
jgi:uncharacterized membrane protein (UPF0127 family)